MVKRKYLIFFFIIFIISPTISFASAWLPTSGSLKYSINTLNIDNGSNALKTKRVALFKQIEQKISALIIKKYILEKKTDLQNKVLIKNIDQQLAKLKLILQELSGFDLDNLTQIEIEQAFDERNSIGLNLLEKNNNFTNANHINVYRLNREYVNRIFYKHVLAEGKNRIYSISPELIIKKNYHKEQFDTEIKFLYGRNKQYQYGNSFYEVIFGIGYSNFAYSPKYPYYNLSSCQGINFNNGFSLTNYTKYDLIQNKNSVYHKTIYEQINISKSFTTPDSINFKQATIGMGYFWYKSLVVRYLKISGFTFFMVVNL